MPRKERKCKKTGGAAVALGFRRDGGAAAL
jgi:hypothetical protein